MATSLLLRENQFRGGPAHHDPPVKDRDQERAGTQLAVPYARETDRCAVRALSQWLQASKIHRGPVFRRMHGGDTVGQERLTDQSVALIIKSRTLAAHLPAGLLPKLSGLSLRAGYATAATAAGIEERKIANVTRHKNITVLRRYIRSATAFDDAGEVLLDPAGNEIRSEQRSGGVPYPRISQLQMCLRDVRADVKTDPAGSLIGATARCRHRFTAASRKARLDR